MMHSIPACAGNAVRPSTALSTPRVGKEDTARSRAPTGPASERASVRAVPQFMTPQVTPYNTICLSMAA